ncbi:MAG: hypothetical protein LLG02_12640 [Pelosinus sp.]|nr:hypothetical protein [Pelosinus sp.]
MTIFLMFFGMIIFLCAYCLGKYQGRQAGIREGKASMLLELREQSLIEGCCFFCGTQKRSISNEIIKQADTDGMISKKIEE